MPEPERRIAKAVTRPFLRTQRRRPAELELRSVCVADVRFTRAARRADAQDVRVRDTLLDHVEVDVTPDVVLAEQRQLEQVCLRLDVFGPELQLLHFYA